MHFLFPWLGYLSPAASNCTHSADRAIESEDTLKTPHECNRDCFANSHRAVYDSDFE
jgi:hypothetical protein